MTGNKLSMALSTLLIIGFIFIFGSHVFGQNAGPDLDPATTTDPLAGPSACAPVTIMPLGDSITDGWSVIGGYRGYLYDSLDNEGYDVDFVGSQTENSTGLGDPDHEGHSGWRADEIRDNIHGWLNANPAEIVLLHIGTNDISQNQLADETAIEIGAILDNIDDWEENNSEVWVILARIINRSDPDSTYGQRTTDLNNQIQSLADARIANDGDKIIVVDMESSLTYPADLDDLVHPNDSGYGKMAGVWEAALNNFLPGYCSEGPAIANLSLTSTSGNNWPTDDLICGFHLTGASTTAATAWYKNGTELMTLFLPMEGGANNALLDFSGNSVGVTTSGAPTWLATGGQDGNGAFEFDNNGYLNAGETFPTSSSYTKMAWVYRTGTTGNNIISGSSNSTGHALWTGNNGNTTLSAGHHGSWATVIDFQPLELATWYFVAVTFDYVTGEMVLYRDGNPVDSATVPEDERDVIDATLLIGSFAGENLMTGRIDDARIYSHVLLPEQIAAMYNSGAGDTNIMVSRQTKASDDWQCRVTSFSDSEIGATQSSNTLTIQSPGTVPLVENLSLTSTSGNNLPTDDLTCGYDLANTATVAATAWYLESSPLMTLYLPMEGGAVNALKDFSGSGNNGTAVGDRAWQATGGSDGQGYIDLDGNDFIDAGDPMPTGGDAYTKSVWVYWVPGNNTNNIISGQSGHALWITQYPENSGVYLSAGHSNPWRDVKDTQVFTPNAWVHVAVTYDPATTTMVLYRNGGEVNRNTSVPSMNDSRTFIGAFSANYFFKGSIDDVRIYKRALSTDQVAELYAMSSHVMANAETVVGDQWQCRVTPFSDSEEGTSYASNMLTVVTYSDADGDGIPDNIEEGSGTCLSSTDDDSDDDGILDGNEDLNQNGVWEEAQGETNFCDEDSDGDLILDGTEIGLASPQGNDTDPAVFVADLDPATTTDPLDDDGDNDGLLDGEEDANQNGAVDAGETNPNLNETCPAEMISYHKLDDANAPYENSMGGPDATCSNCPIPAVGLVGDARQFDGANDEVNVADDSDQFDWASDASFTIEYWMWKNTDCSGDEVIVGRDDSMSSLHWWTGCGSDNKAVFQLIDSTGGGIRIDGAGDPINNGQWHHLVFVRDEGNNENRIYIDGTQTHQGTHNYTAGFGGSAPLNIGYINLDGYYRYDGLLDEVAIYDRALTPAEILRHYEDGWDGLGYCDPRPEPDIDGDGDVDGYDLHLFMLAFEVPFGDTDFDARCDFNMDDAVNAEDLSTFGGEYGNVLPAGPM